MIKIIKKFISKLFGIKQCECSEEVLIVEETAKQKKIREKHKGDSK
jgi:hypothetical protein